MRVYTKNETNNFKLIAELLDFPENNIDQFYYVQIIQRKKDGNNVNGNNRTRLIKSYSIKSKESLLKKEEEIKGLCKLNNARAYIHFTKRSEKTVMEKLMVAIPQYYLEGNYHKCISLFDTACGQTRIKSSSTFLIDLDEEDLSKEDDVICFVRNALDRDILAIIPTASGKHIICSPFNLSEFNKYFPDIDVQKNNPTLLYYTKNNTKNEEL